jgi:hypothetical protein
MSTCTARSILVEHGSVKATCIGWHANFCRWWQWDPAWGPNPECFGPPADTRSLLELVLCDPAADRTAFELCPVATCGPQLDDAEVYIDCEWCGGDYDGGIPASAVTNIDIPPRPGSWVYFDFSAWTEGLGLV